MMILLSELLHMFLRGKVCFGCCLNALMHLKRARMFRKNSFSDLITCAHPQGRVAMIIGHCNYCKSDFCGTHRLPETHQCQAMASCKEIAFNRNAQKLEANKCVAAKV